MSRDEARPLRLVVVGAHPPSLSSLTEYAGHLVAALRRHAGVEDVLVLSDEIDSGRYGPGVKAAWRMDAIGNPLRILREVRRHKPDAVLFNLQNATFGRSPIPAAIGLVAPWLTRLAGVPTMVLLHNLADMVDAEIVGFGGGRMWRTAYRWGGHLVTRLLLRADRVAVTVSRYVDHLETRYRASNVVHIPHGSFGVAPCLPPSGDRPRVLAFGKFGTYKRLEPLFAALEMLWERGVDVAVDVAGSDNPNNRGYLAGLERVHGHRNQVRFLGYVAEQDVPELFRSAWAVVMPYSVTTGSSGVLHQAGDHGRALVMPAIGDFVDLIHEEGYRAETFEPDDPASLAAAIERVISDDELRDRLGRANHRAANAFTMDDVADRYLTELRLLADLPPSNSSL